MCEHTLDRDHFHVKSGDLHFHTIHLWENTCKLTKEKQFSCEVCGSSFTQSSTLKSHKWIHTGDTPFSCEICGFVFSTATNWKKHMRTHYLVGGVVQHFQTTENWEVICEHIGSKQFLWGWKSGIFSTFPFEKIHVSIRWREISFLRKLWISILRELNFKKTHANIHLREKNFYVKFAGQYM